MAATSEPAAPRAAVQSLSLYGGRTLAWSALMPERLSRVSIVSGLGELTAPGTLRGMSLFCGGALSLSPRAPGLSRWLYGGLVGPALGRFPGAAVRLITGIGSPADARIPRDPPVRDVIEHSIGEAFRQGSAGPLQELALITSAWGFDPAQIRAPVQLWHGERDRSVPATMGRHHVRLIPGCSARFLPNEGHFSLIVHHMRDITGALLAGD